MPGPILCGVTSAPEAREAARLAAALSERLEVPLVLVHVVDMPAVAAESLAAAGGRADAERLLASLRRQLGVAADTRVAVGCRSDTLAALAESADASIIVVGSRKSGFRGSKLRSTLALELTTSTERPVVVAPPPDRY